MQDLIDLQGASGARYRFRHVADLSDLPAAAGNFAYVRWTGVRPQVVGCGAANGLGQAAVGWSHAVSSHGANAVYVRLNVVRAARLGEHQDLVEGLRPPMSPPTLD